jgi:hypothetical protein
MGMGSLGSIRNANVSKGKERQTGFGEGSMEMERGKAASAVGPHYNRYHPYNPMTNSHPFQLSSTAPGRGHHSPYDPMDHLWHRHINGTQNQSQHIFNISQEVGRLCYDYLQVKRMGC